MLYGLQNIDFSGIENRTLTPTLEQEAAKAIALAKTGTVLLVALQAVAALSALGMFYLAYKNSKKRSRR